VLFGERRALSQNRLVFGTYSYKVYPTGNSDDIIIIMNGIDEKILKSSMSFRPDNRLYRLMSKI
jgi:hypothetical protein